MLQPPVDLGQAPTAAPFQLRPVDPADRGYVRRTWFESHKTAPRYHRMTWPAFKATEGKAIEALIDHANVRLLGAYALDGKLLGWIAWSPGRSVSTLHYVYVRQLCGETHVRRQGIATALLLAAELGKRVVYTFEGPRRRGMRMDEHLVAWARGRGVNATYVPVKEFLS